MVRWRNWRLKYLGVQGRVLKLYPTAEITSRLLGRNPERMSNTVKGWTGSLEPLIVRPSVTSIRAVQALSPVLPNVPTVGLNSPIRKREYSISYTNILRIIWHSGTGSKGWECLIW